MRVLPCLEKLAHLEVVPLGMSSSALFELWN